MLLFLGAGASRAFGIPTTQEFIALFETGIVEPTQAGLYQDIKGMFGNSPFDIEVLMTVLDDLAKPDEQLWSTISPQTSCFLRRWQECNNEYYDKRDQRREVSKQLLHRLKAIIRQQCIKAVRERKTEMIQRYADFGRVLAAVPNTGQMNAGIPQTAMPNPLRVFTTNYDTCIETYLNERKIEFANGITPRFGENLFMLSAFAAAGKQVEVVKLHGSIDLFKKGEEITQIAALSPDLLGAITPYGEEVGDEFIVFPIHSSGIGHVTQSPYLDLYNLFRNRLETEPSWIVVGFSFRDLTVTSLMNEVLRLKLRKEDRPLVLLIDPEVETIVESVRAGGYATLAEHVKPVKGEFGTNSLLEELGRASERARSGK